MATSGLRVAAEPVRAWYRALRRLIFRSRRAWFIGRTKLAARLIYAHVDMDIARDVILHRRVQVQIDAGTRNRLVIGARTVIRDDVLFFLRGGVIEVGSETEIRRYAMMNSSGTLSVGSSCLVSYGASIGCADSVAIGDFSVLSEYSMMTDSSHARAGVDEKFLDAPVKSEPTSIGRSVWIGGHAIIAPGVHVGDCAFVGGGSVVTKDVPAWWLAVGVPARPVRRLSQDEQPSGEEGGL